MGRADLHTHTKYSGLSKVLFMSLPDSVSEPEAVVRAAEARGLDVLCVTDHNTIRGALEARKHARTVEVVVGEEVGTAEGEVLGLFLTEEIPKGLSAEETIGIIHRQGGLAIAPHPFSAHCSALGMKAFDLPLDGIEVFNSVHRDTYSNDIARRLCEGKGKALTGGSDAHGPEMVGNACTVFEGRSAEDLRKSILAHSTRCDGIHTPLRGLIWMEVTVALRLVRLITLSLRNRPNVEDTVYAVKVFEMPKLNKVLAVLGIMMFLAPPLTILAGFAGERLHSSRSKAVWREIAKANGWEPV